MRAEYDEQKRFIPPSRGWRWSVMMLAVAAMLLAAYHAFIYFHQHGLLSALDVSQSWDYEVVTEGRWSTWFGIPVSLFGLLLYATMFIATRGTGGHCSETRQARSWRIMVATAIAVLVASLWFMIVLATGVRQTCWSCMLVQLIGVATGTMVLFHAPIRLQRRRRPRPDVVKIRRFEAMALAALSLITVLILIVGQLLASPLSPMLDAVSTAQPINKTTESNVLDINRRTPEDDAPFFRQIFEFETKNPANEPATAPSTMPQSPANERISSGKPVSVDTFAHTVSGGEYFRLANGKILINPMDVPLLGDPSAKHLMAIILSERTTGCAQMYKQARETLVRYQGQISLAILFVPMDAHGKSNGNTGEIQVSRNIITLALMIWRGKKDSFPEFVDWLFESDVPRTEVQSMRKAAEILGADTVANSGVDPWIVNHLNRNAEIVDISNSDMRVKSANFNQVPRLLVSTFLIGYPIEDQSELWTIMEKNMVLRPRSH